MKKKVLLIAAIFTAGITFAQDQMTSKKGTPILPEAGDYAIGFDAGNLIDFGGNLFNGNDSNSTGSLSLMNANTIYGKLFIDANTAYRGMLRIGFGSNTVKTPVANTAPGAAAGSTVEDEVKTSATNITIGGGIEMRRGKGRLQGVYGPMVMIMFGAGNTENTYGNNLNDQGAGASRVTENKNGGTFGITLGAFGGVEYFFAPKISVGAEVMWGLNFNSTGAGEVTTESTDGTTITSTTVESGTSSSFGLDVVPNSVISLNFHF